MTLMSRAYLMAIVCVAGVSTLVAAWPLAARGQQSNQMRRIGVLLGSYTESDKAG